MSCWFNWSQPVAAIMFLRASYFFHVPKPPTEQAKAQVPSFLYWFSTSFGKFHRLYFRLLILVSFYFLLLLVILYKEIRSQC